MLEINVGYLDTMWSLYFQDYDQNLDHFNYFYQKQSSLTNFS